MVILLGLAAVAAALTLDVGVLIGLIVWMIRIRPEGPSLFLILGCFCLVLTLVLLECALTLWVASGADRKQYTVPVNARIIDIQETRQMHHRTEIVTYTPVYQYGYDGKVYISSGIGMNKPAVKGTIVPARLNPHKPEKLYVPGVMRKPIVRSLVLSVIGVLLGLLNLSLYLTL